MISREYTPHSPLDFNEKKSIKKKLSYTLYLRYNYVMLKVSKETIIVYSFSIVNEKEIIPKKVGLRIKELRKKRDLTQQKLGELAEIEHKHIQVLEGQKPSSARIDSIYSIARAFEMSLFDFFNHELFKSEPKPIAISKKGKNVLKASSNQGPPRKILFEDSYSFIVLAHPQISRGHLLLSLKRVIRDITELLPEEMYALGDMIRKATTYLSTEYRPDGYNIGFDIGEVAGQREDVFCIHIVPRFKGDSRNPLKTGMWNVLPDS
jgi:diadenosine tetraphosphate (Ap4A) HIT family hydrolase/DNA-binding XRE family transcriptional regulator